MGILQIINKLTGRPMDWVGIDGAASVSNRFGSGKPSRDRFLKLDNAGGIKSAEWPSGAKIQFLTFFAMPVAGTTAVAGDEYVVITVDPLNSALAASYLNQTESLTSDIQWKPIPLNRLIELPLDEVMQNGSLGGGVISAKTVGGLAIDLYIGAN